MLGEGPTCDIMEVLVQQRKSSLLILIKLMQSFAWVYITIMVIVICLLTRKKSINLKLITKMLTFLLNFIKEECLINLMLLILENFL